MAERRRPCVVCGATEGAMTYALDPWCSGLCEKRQALAQDPTRDWEPGVHTGVTLSAVPVLPEVRDPERGPLTWDGTSGYHHLDPGYDLVSTVTEPTSSPEPPPEPSAAPSRQGEVIEALCEALTDLKECAEALRYQGQDLTRLDTDIAGFTALLRDLGHEEHP